MTETNQQFVQDADVYLNEFGSWIWSYRLGDKHIQGSANCKTFFGHSRRARSVTEARRALDEHLIERGLSRNSEVIE